MASNIDTIVLNGSNYAVWEVDMETLLKSKRLWQYMKTVIPDPMEEQAIFVVDGKKDEYVGVITTYISWEIHFDIIGIDCPHKV
jgi:hypothetical protein